MTAAQTTVHDDDDDRVIGSRGQREQKQQLVEKRIVNLVWGPKGKQKEDNEEVPVVRPGTTDMCSTLPMRNKIKKYS